MTMAPASGQVFDQNSVPVQGASVYVYGLDGSLASLTSDGTNGIANPLTTDEFGAYSYQATVAYYNEDIWFGGQRRWRNMNVAVGSPGADLALRSDLANGTDPAKGSALVNFLPSGTGAVARPLQTKLRDIVDVRDFGVVGNSNGTTGNGNDDTTAYQAAVNYAASTGRRLCLPDRCIIRTTAPITATNPVAIVGSGVSPFVGAPGTLGAGSWLYFDHTGVGLSFDGTAATNAISGVWLHNFGTIRNQPAPGVGWTPTANDYDISLLGCQATLENLTLLNPTKGIKADKGGYARLTMRNISGQFMQVGIYIDKQYDVCFLDTFRNWSFWKDDANVEAYTAANCHAIYLQRVDNPQFSNIFSVRHHAGIRIGQSATVGAYPGGSTSKCKISNIDCDLGTYGIWIDTTVTSAAVELDVCNFSAAGNNLTGSSALRTEGTASDISITNLDSAAFDLNAVRIFGTGNTVRIGGRIKVAGFDHAAAGYPAFEAASGNTIILMSSPFVTGGGSGGTYKNTGTVITPDWQDYVPTITPGSGSFTTVTTTVAKFRHTENRVEVDIDFTLTNAGTGAGSINITLPITSVGDVILDGYIASGGAGSLLIANGEGSSSVSVVKSDGTTSAIATGNRIRLVGAYRV